MTDVRDLLPLYALGALDADEARAVERAVAADPALARELATYRDTAAELAPAVAPPADVQARLLSSIGAGRYEAFAPRLATIYDVPLARAREYLGLIDRPASWKESKGWGVELAGIALVDFAGGPAYAAADCGFVRIAAGCTFPWHMHRGEELNLVLAGTLRDHAGHVYRPGDEVVLSAGDAHELMADPGEDVLIAARLFVGIEVVPRP
jgi:hypothetical protein